MSRVTPPNTISRSRLCEYAPMTISPAPRSRATSSRVSPTVWSSAGAKSVSASMPWRARKLAVSSASGAPWAPLPTVSTVTLSARSRNGNAAETAWDASALPFQAITALRVRAPLPFLGTISTGWPLSSSTASTMSRSDCQASSPAWATTIRSAVRASTPMSSGTKPSFSRQAAPVSLRPASSFSGNTGIWRLAQASWKKLRSSAARSRPALTMASALSRT